MTARKRRPNAYPKPVQIPDHLWLPLRFSLAANPTNASRILRDFCALTGISMDEVTARFTEEAEALCDDSRTLH